MGGIDPLLTQGAKKKFLKSRKRKIEGVRLQRNRLDWKNYILLMDKIVLVKLDLCKLYVNSRSEEFYKLEVGWLLVWSQFGTAFLVNFI